MNLLRGTHLLRGTKWYDKVQWLSLPAPENGVVSSLPSPLRLHRVDDVVTVCVHGTVYTPSMNTSYDAIESR